MSADPLVAKPETLARWIGPLPASCSILGACCGRAVVYLHPIDSNAAREVPWPRCTSCGARTVVVRGGVRIYHPAEQEERAT